MSTTVPRASNAKSIVITGASSGIGAALAFRYARARGMLGLVARDKTRLESVAECCRASGCEAPTATIDIRDRPALAEWLKEFDRASPVNIVIANAGVQTGTTPDGKLEDSEDAYALMKTNILGVLNTVQPLIPRMLKRGRGQIVLMSSIGALFPLADSGAYCASKAAVLTYGLAQRDHLYSAGVRVTAICPGYVTSSMSARSTAWKPLEMSAEAAADHIFRKLRRDRAVIIFPGVLALAAYVGTLLPDSLRRAAMRPFRFYVAPPPKVRRG